VFLGACGQLGKDKGHFQEYQVKMRVNFYSSDEAEATLLLSGPQKTIIILILEIRKLRFRDRARATKSQCSEEANTKRWLMKNLSPLFRPSKMWALLTRSLGFKKDPVGNQDEIRS
jgi:hypothetical protein